MDRQIHISLWYEMCSNEVQITTSMTLNIIVTHTMHWLWQLFKLPHYISTILLTSQIPFTKLNHSHQMTFYGPPVGHSVMLSAHKRMAAGQYADHLGKYYAACIFNSTHSQYPLHWSLDIVQEHHRARNRCWVHQPEIRLSLHRSFFMLLLWRIKGWFEGFIWNPNSESPEKVHFFCLLQDLPEKAWNWAWYFS